MIVKCKNCGTEFEKRGKYCPSCGCYIGDLKENESIKSNNNMLKSNKGIIIGILLIIAGVILIIITCAVYSDEDDTYEPTLYFKLLSPPYEINIECENRNKITLQVDNIERTDTIICEDGSAEVYLELIVTMTHNSNRGFSQDSSIKYEIEFQNGIIRGGEIYIPEIDEGESILVETSIEYLYVEEEYTLRILDSSN